MPTGRLVIVTGKGGVGKTTVAAALASTAAAEGQQTLILEIARPGRLATVLTTDPLTHTPRSIAAGIEAVRLEEEQCLATFIEKLIPLRIISSRLLSSRTFQILCAAIPGILEAALLDRVREYVEGDGPDSPRYDLVILDAPASGHSVPLLAAPYRLATMAALGPLGDSLRRTQQMLSDATRTQAAVVAIPEDWAVAESLELHQALHELPIALLPPILNQVWPRRFQRAEEHTLQNAAEDNSIDPSLLLAGEIFRYRRKLATAANRQLKEHLGVRPIELPFLFEPSMTLPNLAPLSTALLPVVTNA